ncbi:regulator of G-protein signaling 21 isoform X1 [Sander lucioperca]|uniref:Regulator of G protein signaling 1 n=1 Tax=Sander lucioperca TaxID=283035 RepID=A0A8C9YFL2_SANLU|nr:regulator of G-protein signaling 21 isoform X1 [Sander lucioperca]
MPKLLFSKIRFNEIRDLIQNVKRPRRIDIVLNGRRQKKDIQPRTVQNINDETYPSKISWQTDHKLHPTMETLLHNKKYLAAFRSFLQSEFSEENIDFWLACEDFRWTTSQDDLRWKAEGIYQEFIQPSACREINVDHHIRERIKKSLEKPSHSCFDEAQKHVYLLMERDSCPRFLQSDAYLSLKHKSRSLWYI